MGLSSHPQARIHLILEDKDGNQVHAIIEPKGLGNTEDQKIAKFRTLVASAVLTGKLIDIPWSFAGLERQAKLTQIIFEPVAKP